MFDPMRTKATPRAEHGAVPEPRRETLTHVTRLVGCQRIEKERRKRGAARPQDWSRTRHSRRVGAFRSGQVRGGRAKGLYNDNANAAAKRIPNPMTAIATGS